MSMMPMHLSPEAWLRHMFSSRAAADGGVIRRKIVDVDRFVGRQAFLNEMMRRGFPVVENGGQYVVFCNREPIRRVV